jgi:large subunit ribosomal protein L25
MSTSSATALPASARAAAGSREARRLRRAGLVPGVVYGGGKDPLAFQIDARELRHALAGTGAVLDLQVDGGKGQPVVIKEVSRHPVSGEIIHIDLLRVRLDVEIQATVPLELTGAEDAPGVKEGGVLEHVTRELTIEALPNEIPDSITHDVSEMQVGDTLTLESIVAPDRVRIVGDAETVIATVTPPRLQAEPAEEIEQETEVVGEPVPGEEAAEAEAPEAEGATSDEAAGE